MKEIKVINYEKIENNKLQDLKKKVALLEHRCKSLQQQLILEIDIVNRLEKVSMRNSIEFIAVALCLVYLLLR